MTEAWRAVPALILPCLLCSCWGRSLLGPGVTGAQGMWWGGGRGRGAAVRAAPCWAPQDDERFRLADPICTFVFALLVLFTTRLILQVDLDPRSRLHAHRRQGVPPPRQCAGCTAAQISAAVPTSLPYASNVNQFLQLRPRSDHT